MDTTLGSFVISHLPQLGTKLIEQIYLVCLSMLLAILIAIPLGLMLIRFKKLKQAILGLASIIWTIPSLALFALFIPVLGIGVKPAIVVLSIYGVLPILRNTIAGIENIPEQYIEASKALGFNQYQRFWIVELPLATPVIVAGIRIATSISVGIATLAAFIGAGGLGDFINQGLSLNNHYYLLLGAVPAALLALLLDFIIAKMAQIINQRKIYKKRKKIAWSLAALLTLVTMPFIYSNIIAQPNKNTIRIATKNFTEQLILGELMAKMIEAHTNLRVIRKFNLGTTAICHTAMLKGEIDLYPEYTSTAYLLILHEKNHQPSDAIYQKVKQAYQRQFKIIWLSPFGFNNTNSIAVRADFAKKHQLHSISDLKAIENIMILGAPPEFVQRPDALVGLQQIYGLKIKPEQLRQMAPALIYQAVVNGAVNVINAFSTDGKLQQYDLVILKDNKHLYSSYYAAPLVRETILKEHPEIKESLQPLLGRIDEQTIRQLNYAVEVDKKSPEQVAQDFLVKEQLLL